MLPRHGHDKKFDRQLMPDVLGHLCCMLQGYLPPEFTQGDVCFQPCTFRQFFVLFSNIKRCCPLIINHEAGFTIYTSPINFTSHFSILVMREDVCGWRSVCFFNFRRTAGKQREMRRMPIIRKMIPCKKGNTKPNSPSIMKMIPMVSTSPFFNFCFIRI